MISLLQDGLDRCKKSLRLEPIGVDRHFKLYWVFSQGMPGIYVEDGYMYYDARENRTIDRQGKVYITFHVVTIFC